VAPNSRAENGDGPHYARRSETALGAGPQARDVRSMAEHDDRGCGERRRDGRRGLPSAYASGGSASDASTEPSEMYFVSQTTAAKIASAGGSATASSTANTPHAVATPLPPRKPEPHGNRCDRRWPPSRRRRRGRVRCPTVRRATRSLRPFAMSSAATITPAVTPDARITFAAPRLPLPTRRRSDAAPSPRQNQRERNRSDEIAGNNREGHGHPSYVASGFSRTIRSALKADTTYGG